MSRRDPNPTPKKPSFTRRGFLKGGAASAAAAGALGLPGCSGGSAATNPQGGGPGGSGGTPPNILILLCDEMRYPPIYESSTLQAWRTQYLRTQNALRASGMEFHRHYAASTACSPSRASLYTGQYPSLHGVAQTTGAAKEAFDPDVFWLDPNSVPTFGDYFRAAGYMTFWRGKWHASNADMVVSGTHEQLPSYDEYGIPVPSLEADYLGAGRLDPHGFTGWIGPEPHGKNPLNSGSSAKGAESRDPGFADQAIDLLDTLDQSNSNTPWLTVASFVNPHDITLFGLFANQSGAFDFSINPDTPTDLFDPNLFAMTRNEDLSTKPSCQESYRDSYAVWMQPIPNELEYYRLYYQLQKNVDDQMYRVYQKLMSTRFFDNTIVVFTSDHGDMLGSHGYMHQKWYQVYDETVRVPLIISNPVMFPQPESVDLLTSHIDLLPTLLGLAGYDSEDLRPALMSSHTDAQALVGRDLAPFIRGEVPPTTVAEPLFFMTNDDPSRGLDQDNFVGIPYNSVVQPTSIWCVIARINGEVWKLARYFDNPEYWSTPGDPNDPNSGAQDVILKELALPPSQPGTEVIACERTLKVTPVGDQYEMYNVSTGPLELDNLYGNATFAAEQAELELLLAQQCALKRLLPNNGPVAGQPQAC